MAVKMCMEKRRSSRPSIQNEDFVAKVNQNQLTSVFGPLPIRWGQFVLALCYWWDLDIKHQFRNKTKKYAWRVLQTLNKLILAVQNKPPLQRVASDRCENQRENSIFRLGTFWPLFEFCFITKQPLIFKYPSYYIQYKYDWKMHEQLCCIHINKKLCKHWNKNKLKLVILIQNNYRKKRNYQSRCQLKLICFWRWNYPKCYHRKTQ